MWFFPPFSLTGCMSALTTRNQKEKEHAQTLLRCHGLLSSLTLWHIIPQYLESKFFLVSELRNWDERNAALHWRQNLSVWGGSKSLFHRDATESLWIWHRSRVPRVQVMFSIYLPSWPKHTMPHTCLHVFSKYLTFRGKLLQKRETTFMAYILYIALLHTDSSLLSWAISFKLPVTF